MIRIRSSVASVSMASADGKQPVVVGGHGERPFPGHFEIVLEKSGRGVGGQQRIPAFVDRFIDGEKNPAGGFRELPHADRARPGNRAPIVRRLHVGKVDKLLRQAVILEDPPDRIEVPARADQTLRERLAQPALRTDVFSGFQEISGFCAAVKQARELSVPAPSSGVGAFRISRAFSKWSTICSFSRRPANPFSFFHPGCRAKVPSHPRSK